MYKKISAKCEDSRVSGSLCHNDTITAVSYKGPEGQTIYVGLCDRHSRQLVKMLPQDAKPLSVEYAERIMNNYHESSIAEHTNSPEDSTPMEAVAVVETPVVADTTPSITMPALSAEPIDLLAVAAQLQTPSNGNGAVHTSVVVEVARSIPAKPVLPHVPCEKADQLRELAATLRAQATLAPAAAKEILKTAEDLEARAAKAQDAADKEASKPAPRALDGLPLVRLALLQCGVMNLDAIERAIDAGILSVKKQAKVTVQEGDKETSSTPRAAVTHATSRGHSEEIKSRVYALKAQGFSDNAIGKEVGLSASTVYSMCKRAAA
jgi:hypothetical protein